MGRKQVSNSFMSTAFLGNISELDSLQAFISQKGYLTTTFRPLGTCKIIFYGRCSLYVDNH